jgi:glycosyltransferase involved in cell wall biosynthesis
MLREKVAEAAFAVPISAFNREVILEACDGRYADKLVIIHCGVDTDIFQVQAETADNRSNGRVTPNPFTLLCIGTLHEVKGQTHLIEACRLLHRRGVSLACHFIGDGPDLASLTEQASQADLADCVHFHGRQTRAEIVRQLQTADVIVAPSVPSQDGRREGIPVALMEAMASGAPVVASRLSGIPELVEDGQNGLLTPPGDATALADALYRLYENPALRHHLGQAGRNRILREFDLRANVAALAQRFHQELFT